MVTGFRRKIAARSDGKLHCLLGELNSEHSLEELSAAGAEPEAAGAGAAGAEEKGGRQLPQQFDLAVTHMTAHHIPDIVGTCMRTAFAWACKLVAVPSPPRR